MSNMEKVHKIAIKWYDKLCDADEFFDPTDPRLGDDCRALGFIMDCGESFGRQYGSAAYDYKALKGIADKVTDISLLGSAIYSRWRYFDHWAYSAEEITNQDNRKWFVIAFKRLAQLSEEKC